MTALIVGPDGKPRCHWCAATPGYLHYHDREWGFPVARFTGKDVDRLLQDAGSVRHRGKIETSELISVVVAAVGVGLGPTLARHPIVVRQWSLADSHEGRE